MKIFGYDKNNDELGLLSLREATICTNPKTLREIAKFLEFAAKKMEANIENFDHIHLRDNWSDWDKNGADIIIGKEHT